MSRDIWTSSKYPRSRWYMELTYTRPSRPEVFVWAGFTSDSDPQPEDADIYGEHTVTSVKRVQLGVETCGQAWVAEIELCYRCGMNALAHAEANGWS